MQKIYIKGHSGCDLSIINDTTIFKSSPNKTYTQRLKAQCEKQKAFSMLFKDDAQIKIPEILSQKWGSNNAENGFSMSYIYADDFISFFEKSDINTILRALNSLFYFINANLKNSTINKLKKELLEHKFISTKENIKAKIKPKMKVNLELQACFKDIEKELISLPNTLHLPLGACHGDLTLSNVLFLKDKIVLIDFLDSFIESPLQDIVKLRQDSKYHWSLRLFKGKYDKTKIKIILNFLDALIDKYFAKYQFYQAYYRIFQKISLFRILPYTQDEEIIKFLSQEIQTI